MNRNFKTLLVSVGIILVAAFIGAIIGVSRQTAATAAQETMQTATQAVDREHPPATVSVLSSMVTMGVGESFPVGARYDGSRTADGAAYTVDRADVLTVDASGNMKAAKAGYAIVTVTSFNNLVAKCYVTVKNAPSSVAFPCEEVVLQKGEKTVFSLQPATDTEGFAAVKYACADSGILTIDAAGSAVAAKAGSTVITGAVYNGKSAQVKVTVLDNNGFTDKTTVAKATLRQQAGWHFPSLADVPAGAAVQQYGATADGRWLKVKYNNSYGWIYNKAFGTAQNYTEYTVQTLPVMADDLLFDIGADKRAVFDFVFAVSYSTDGDGTTEDLCVQYFQKQRGSCFHHAALLCYLYNRCGWETLRVNGISALDHESEHSWCLCKTEKGWKHVDAQEFSIRTADEQYFIDDYSPFFNWDKDKFPAIETAATR